MAIYITIYCFILLFCLSKRSFSHRGKRISLLVIICVFLCTGYMTGSDWRPYESSYNQLNSLEDIKSYNKELGFAYLLFFAKKIGLGFWELWITIKFFCFYIIIKKLSEFTNKKYKWALLYFYSYFALFYFIDNPMRNLISATLFLFSYKYLISRHSVRYFLIVILCSMLHSSALLFIPLYFLLPYNRRLSNRTLIIICLSLYVLLLLTWSSGVRGILYTFLHVISGSESRGIYYLDIDSSSNYISFGLIVVYSIFGLVLYKRDNIEENTKFGNFLVYMSTLYVVTYTLGFFLPILSRLSMFCYIPFLATFSIAMKHLSHRYYLIFSIYVSLFLFVVMCKNITRDFRYIPYSTYFEYIGTSKPDFSTRSSYNPLYSPYKSDDYVYQHYN